MILSSIFLKRNKHLPIALNVQGGEKKKKMTKKKKKREKANVGNRVIILDTSLMSIKAIEKCQLCPGHK